jgi:N-acetylmuramic acid 6-phosphate etherase
LVRTLRLEDELSDLSTEGINQKTRSLGSLSTEDILKKINDEDSKVPQIIRKEIPEIAKAVDAIVHSLQNQGRLFYVGAGTSGRLAVIDAAELLPTFGAGTETVKAIIAGGRKAVFHSVEGAEDDEAQAKIDLERSRVSKDDVLLGISASGRTPFVVGALVYARKLGARTIALTSNQGSRITKIADIAICPETGPEVIAGSTRMKAGTTQKLVLNMISTTAMVRLGRVHGNLMVSLKPVSAKLVDRQLRILMQATGLPREPARHALQEARGNVKIAILMIESGASYLDAERCLKNSESSLDKALATTKPKKTKS